MSQPFNTRRRSLRFKRPLAALPLAAASAFVALTAWHGAAACQPSAPPEAKRAGQLAAAVALDRTQDARRAAQEDIDRIRRERERLSAHLKEHDRAVSDARARRTPLLDDLRNAKADGERAHDALQRADDALARAIRRAETAIDGMRFGQRGEIEAWSAAAKRCVMLKERGLRDHVDHLTSACADFDQAFEKVKEARDQSALAREAYDATQSRLRQLHDQTDALDKRLQTAQRAQAAAQQRDATLERDLNAALRRLDALNIDRADAAERGKAKLRELTEDAQ